MEANGVRCPGGGRPLDPLPMGTSPSFLRQVRPRGKLSLDLDQLTVKPFDTSSAGPARAPFAAAV